MRRHLIFSQFSNAAYHVHFTYQCVVAAYSESYSTFVLVPHQLVTDYAKNHVDTLHMKNLLHLSEDRYLTTPAQALFELQNTIRPRCTCLHCCAR